MSSLNIAKISLNPDRQYSQQEYEATIEALANKGSNYIMVENHSLKVVGLATHIWETIKGILGFENKTSVPMVHLHLLQFVRYGEKRHFLDDVKIKEILKNLQKVLDKESRHREIVKIIAEALSVDTVSRERKLDNAITAYVQKQGSRLDEAFWPKFMHRFFASAVKNRATLNYNQGLIQASKGRYQEAVAYLENAVNRNPAYYPDLVKARLELCSTKLTEGSFTAAEKQIELAVNNMQEGKLVGNAELSKLLKTNIQELADKQMSAQNYEKAFDTWTSLDIFGAEYIQNRPDVQAKQLYALAKIKESEGNLIDALARVKEANQLFSEEKSRLLQSNLEKALSGQAHEQYNKARQELDNGNFSVAIELYQKLLTGSPDNSVYKRAIIDAYIKVGDHALNAKQIDNAIQQYKLAMEASKDETDRPVYGPYVNKMIEAYRLLGDPKINVKNYETLAKLFPNNDLIKLNPNDYVDVVNFTLNLHRFQIAFDIASSASRQFPDNKLIKKVYAAAVYGQKLQYDPPVTDKECFDVYIRVTDISDEAPVDCYVNLAKLYAKAIESGKDIDTGMALNESKKAMYKHEAIKSMKKAAAIENDNIRRQYECAKYLWKFSVDHDELPYLEKAYNSDPNDIDYAYGYSQALLNKLGDPAAKEHPVYQEISTKISRWMKDVAPTTVARPNEILSNRWDTL